MIKQSKTCSAVAVLACVMLFGGCSTEPAVMPSAVQQQTPVVVVTSFPLYAMATEIGGDAVAVEWPGQAAPAPRDWVPLADDIQLLQTADLILLNGAGYERWTQNLSLPRSRTIDTTTPATGLAGYTDQLLTIDGQMTHQHGPRGSQSAGAIADITWLAPALAVAQLNRVELELTKLVPDQRDEISIRASELRQQLTQIGVRLSALKLDTAKILADSHDVAYLVSALKCELHSLEPNADPAVDFAAALQTLKPRLLFFRKNAPAEIRQLFVESAVPAVAIDACDQPQKEPSFVDRLNGNVDRLEAAVREEVAPKSLP